MIVLLLFLCFHVCTCSLHTRSVGSLCTEAKKLAYIPVWRLRAVRTFRAGIDENKPPDVPSRSSQWATKLPTCLN